MTAPWRRLFGNAGVLLLVAGALWIHAAHVFNEVPNRRTCRFDFGDSVAYPISDAGCDYQNALAIVSGDGWVNWRETNRWSVYKPGWAAFLALLALVSRADPERMQWLITLALAAIPAALYFVVRALFPGRWAAVAAILAALGLLHFPATGSWWFVRCMMTEGPTLLLLLAFCGLAVSMARRRSWRWGEALTCGLVAGALSMVRSQARYAVVAVALVLIVAALRRFRARGPILAAALVGYLAVTGPYLIKTSVHLGQPYFGTSILDLWAVLAWSPAGKAVGGETLDPSAFSTEAEALNAMWRKTREAIDGATVSISPGIDTGLRMFGDYTMATPARIVGRSVSDPTFRGVALALALAGLAIAWARLGVVAFVPLLAGLGYIAPLAVVDYFQPRFGDPISWIGLAYLAGPVALLIDRRERTLTLRAVGARRRWLGRRYRRFVASKRASRPASIRAGVHRSPSPPRLLLIVLAVWIFAATAGLLWLDRRPPPQLSASALLAAPRVAILLDEAGVARDAGLEREVDRALSGTGDSPFVLVGVAHLPTFVGRDAARVPNRWFRLQPAREAYTALLLATPWKSAAGRFELRLLTVPGRLAPDFRNGDQVVVILDEPDTPSFPAGVDFAPTVRARAIFSTRWAAP